MKLRERFSQRNWVVREIARFGSARLVRLASGRVEVRGGTREDRMEAREWASYHCHEAIVQIPRKPSEPWR